MDFSKAFDLIKTTFSQWSEDKAPRLAAALSYYTVFSLAPLLIIVIAVVGFIFERAAVQEQLMSQIQSLIGAEGALTVQTMIEGRRDTGDNLIASIISIAVLLFAATGVFGQLEDALNTMWEVAPKPGRGVWGIIKDRFFSFTMVMGVAFLLLVSLVVSTALSALGDYLIGLFPGAEFVMQIVSFVVSFLVITLLFSLIFKVVPDAEVAWRDVWLGAAVTALLFTIGKEAIGIYLGNTDMLSAFGAAGSLVVILLWVYYSAQILFLGAEFTQVYANKYGSRVVPAEDAVPVTEEARQQQGIPHRESVEKATLEGTSAEEASRRAERPLASQKEKEKEPELLPQPQPSLLVFSAILTALVGFISGMVIKRGK